MICCVAAGWHAIRQSLEHYIACSWELAAAMHRAIQPTQQPAFSLGLTKGLTAPCIVHSNIHALRQQTLLLIDELVHVNIRLLFAVRAVEW
jgi:hypothetical protein